MGKWEGSVSVQDWCTALVGWHVGGVWKSYSWRAGKARAIETLPYTWCHEGEQWITQVLSAVVTLAQRPQGQVSKKVTLKAVSNLKNVAKYWKRRWGAVGLQVQRVSCHDAWGWIYCNTPDIILKVCPKAFCVHGICFIKLGVPWGQHRVSPTVNTQ